MELINRVLGDALVLQTKAFHDERGYFSETFSERRFKEISGWRGKFVQDNLSVSQKGTLRGIHFQTGDAAQAKLVRVVHGEAFDMAIDLRPNSPTFQQCYGVKLSPEANNLFFIPRGFGHAFLALEDHTIFEYKVDNYYSKKHESGIHWNGVDIVWPEIEKKLSRKDSQLLCIHDLEFNGIWQSNDL